jgi:hypothetical protein
MKGRDVVNEIFFQNLDDVKTRKTFEEFLEKRYVGEIGRFLSAVASYKQQPSAREANEIFDKFIDPLQETGENPFDEDTSGKDTLNLSATQVDIVRTKLIRPDEFIFDDVVEEMKRLLNVNDYLNEFVTIQDAARIQRVQNLAKTLGLVLLLGTAITIGYLQLSK